MADAVIVSTARTPIGKAFRGIFNDTHGADMGAHVIKHAAERAKVDLAEVEDVILGCAAPEGTTAAVHMSLPERNRLKLNTSAPARPSRKRTRSTLTSPAWFTRLR